MATGNSAGAGGGGLNLEYDSGGGISHGAGVGGTRRRSHARSVSQGGASWANLTGGFNPDVPPLASQGSSLPGHASSIAPHQTTQSILMNPGAAATAATTPSAVMAPVAAGATPLVGHRTHQRTFSHGQTIDGATANHRGHKRAGSKTEFILPDGHDQREKARSSKPQLAKTSSFPLGHKRNSSRTESVYTIRENKVPLIQRIMFWRKVGALVRDITHLCSLVRILVVRLLITY